MKYLKKAVFFVLIAGLTGVVHTLHVSMDKYREIHFVDTSPVFLPKGNTLRALSMGYRSVLADVLWIKSVLYYGRRVIDEDNPYFVYAQNKGTLQKELQSVRRDAQNSVDDSIRDNLKHILYKQSSKGLLVQTTRKSVSFTEMCSKKCPTDIISESNLLLTFSIKLVLNTIFHQQTSFFSS